jgi:hypothetical protein
MLRLYVGIVYSTLGLFTIRRRSGDAENSKNLTADFH